MAENKYQEEGATEIDFAMRNYEYANMAADMGQCRIGFATDLKAVCAKGDSGATVYKFLKDASGSSNTPSTRLFFADANGAASSHASLTFDGTTLKIAGALRKAGESVDNLTLGAAGLVTLGGNLALGANTISRDGAAGKGLNFGTTGIPTVTATATPNGDVRYAMVIRDDTSYDIGDGGGIAFYGKTNSVGSYGLFGGIKASKENATEGNNASSIYIQTRANGSDPANALRLDSSQNGYIKNKLMVGSLTEEPDNQLSVFKDARESVFLSIGNSNTGQNGVRIGLDQVLENGIPTEHVVFDMQYTTRAITFRSESSVAGVYANLMSLYFGPEQTLIDIAGQLHVAGSSSLANVEAEDVSINNLEVDDTFTTKVIKADWYSGHLPLYIKNATDAVYAKFETIGDDIKTVTIADKLVVGSLDETPDNQLVLYNAEATGTFIQVLNGAAGTEEGLLIGVAAANGDPIIKVDRGRYLRFQSESSSGPRDMATLSDTGTDTVRFHVNGHIQCEAFHLNQTPLTGTITPNKYIVISCKDGDYKIPVAAV
jgi:hypothetical protein